MAFTKQQGKKDGGKGQQQYDDSNRGVLFQNDKDGNDARPDMTGKIAIRVADFEEDENGLIQVRLAAWQKESSKAGDYLSLSASPAQKGE